jgi:hypothetical protein
MSAKLSAAASANPGRTLAGSEWIVPLSLEAVLVPLIATTTGIAAGFNFLRAG